MSLWDDEAGYDRTDPKHPDFADMAADRADMERKRMKEDPDYAESFSGAGAQSPSAGSTTPAPESDEEEK